jgi:cellulose synthase/poly-beta-1,6-N-acetylglucosamine synthase-like glycosyltransferase
MSQWEILRQTVQVIHWSILGLLSVQLGLFLFVLGAAWIAVARRPPVASPVVLWRRYADVAPGISIIAPAYNESLTIVQSCEALLALEYPSHEVIVVDDGSTDDTLQRLIDRFGLQSVAHLIEPAAPHAPIRKFYASPRVPGLLVIEKQNGGGKADAVNAGINASRMPIICITDADTLIEPDALLRGIWPFVDDPERTVAVGGTICIANGSKVRGGRVVEARLPDRFLALVQVLEYGRSFMLARVGLSHLGALTIVSGAFGLFRRDAVIAVGGYSLGTVGEDMELTIKLHRHFRSKGQPYKVRFLAEPVIWTQAPETLGDLGRQRARWQRGALESWWKHRTMTLNPKYGSVGMIGFGHILIVDVIGPVVAVTGYVLLPAFWAAGLLSLEHLKAFMAAVFSFGILTSVGSLIVEQMLIGRIVRARDLATLGAIAVVENFGYRQLCQFWRLQGSWQYLRGKQEWGPMVRKAFKEA